MKNGDQQVELRVLKSIICKQNKTFFVLLQDDHFTNLSLLNILRRTRVIFKSTGIIPTEDYLFSEGTLSPSDHVFFSGGRIEEEERLVLTLFNILDSYRRSRIVFEAITKAAQDMMALEDPTGVDACVTELQSSLRKASSVDETDGFEHFSQSTSEAMREIVKADLEDDSEDRFLATGFSSYDRMSGGQVRKKLYVVAAPPGGGKTLFALQVALNQFLMGHRICFVSFEMDHKEIRDRLLSNIARVKHTKLTLKTTTKEENGIVLAEFESWISGGPGLLSVWCPGKEMDIHDIMSQVGPMKYDHVIVDYLGLLKDTGKENQQQELGSHARAAKLCSFQYNCVMTLLAQLDDQTLRVKYSKAIEAHADNILVWAYGDVEKKSKVLSIKQQKARNSSPDPFNLYRDAEYMRIEDYLGITPNDAYASEDVPEMPKFKKKNKN